MKRTFLLAATGLTVAALSSPSLAQDWTLDKILDGPAASSQYGYAVAGLNDVDGQGTPDIAVGAFSADLNGTGSGAIYVVSGENGATLYSALGEGPGDLLGFAVARIGDLTGDGRDEFAATAPFFSDGPAGSFAGRVYIIDIHDVDDGGVLDTIDGFAAGELFGSAVAAVDTTGDATPELLVGAPGAGPGATGAVYHFEWNAVSETYEVPTPIPGSAPGEYFGYSLADAGDVLGGASHEFLVGAPFADGDATGSGAIDLYRANLAFSTSFSAAMADAHLGVSVAGGKDLTGDGVADIAAGGPDHMGGTGTVVVWNTDTGVVLRNLAGESAGDLFGYSIAWLTDVSEDGRPELVVGSPGANSDAGRAEVFDLSPAPLLGGGVASLLVVDGDPQSELGWSVALVGDQNDNGLDDLAIGAPGHTGPDGAQQGQIQTWLAVEPVRISLLGPITAGLPVQVQARHLQPGTTAEFWVDFDSNPVGGDRRFATLAPDGNGEAVATLSGTATGNYGAGTQLFFQVRELGEPDRLSNVVNDFVLPPPTITVSAPSVDAGDPVDVMATNLMPGATIHFWVDTDNDPIGGFQEFATEVADQNGMASATLPGTVTDMFPDQRLYFQIQEDDGGVLRESNVRGVDIIGMGGPGFTLAISGPCTVSAGLTLTAAGAINNRPVVFYGALSSDPGAPSHLAPGQLGNLGVMLNLNLNRAQIRFATADVNGDVSVSFPQLKPGLVNRDIFFQAVSIDSVSNPNPANFLLSDVPTCTPGP